MQVIECTTYWGYFLLFECTVCLLEICMMDTSNTLVVSVQLKLIFYRKITWLTRGQVFDWCGADIKSCPAAGLSFSWAWRATERHQWHTRQQRLSLADRWQNAKREFPAPYFRAFTIPENKTWRWQGKIATYEYADRSCYQSFPITVSKFGRMVFTPLFSSFRTS